MKFKSGDSIEVYLISKERAKPTWVPGVILKVHKRGITGVPTITITPAYDIQLGDKSILYGVHEDAIRLSVIGYMRKKRSEV